MRHILLAMSIVCFATPAMAQMRGGGMGQDGGGGGWGGHRGGGERRDGQERGRERRGPEFKPIKRDVLDRMVTATFQELDTNHDGMITLAEVDAVLAARRDQAIRDRFAAIDTNHDKLIEPDEFMAWQRSAGDAVALGTEAGVNGGVSVDKTIAVAGGDKDDARMLRRILGPIDAVAITQANSNYDGGTSLAELLAFEQKKFDAIDTNHDGELSLDELRAAKLVGGDRGGEGGDGAGWRGRRGDRGGGAGGMRGDGPPPNDGKN